MIPDPIAETTHWRVVASKEHFDKVKKEERFWALVALARAINALRFVQMPMITQLDDPSPAGMRARFNSMLFAMALFVESNRLVQKLNRHFGNIKEFQDLANATNRNRRARELLESGLTVLRNMGVFHFDIDEIGKQIRDLELNEPIFAQAMGKTNGQVYYELADHCVVRTVGEPLPADEKQALELLATRMSVTMELISEFATAAEKFIDSLLTNEGWKGMLVRQQPPVATARILSS
jgi:hypothetical protein